MDFSFRLDSCANRAKRWVDGAKALIGFAVDFFSLGVGLEALRDFERLLAGCIRVWPGPNTDSSKQRRSVCSAFFGGENFSRMPIDIGLYPSPEQPACAASTEADSVDGNGEFGEEGKGVAQREGDSLKHGASEMRRGVAGGDTDEGCGGVRIEVWGAFTEQIGRVEESVAAGGNVGGGAA